MTEERDAETVWTVPNVLTGARLLGLAPLLWVARGGHRAAFLAVMVALLVTDWLDGKFAKVLGQRTVLGARLDSAVDAAMYASVAVCFWWLEGEVMRELAWWFLAVGVTWTLSALVSLARFDRLPSYHSWAAKASWAVVGVTAVHWLLSGRGTFVPWALSLVVLTNLEAMAIGAVLPEWRADVPTLRHALRMREGTHASNDEGVEGDAARERDSD